MMSARPKTLPEIPMGAVLSAAATVVVIGAIVSGLMVIDGPEVERRLRLDKTRVLDLERIASAIDCYWRPRNVRFPISAKLGPSSTPSRKNPIAIA
jgi:hypothetical protein